MGIIKITKKVSGVALLIIGTTACDQGIRADRIRLNSPLSKDSLGLAVQGVSEQELQSVLEKYPEAEVRVINKKQGLYEVYNIKASDLGEFVSSENIVANDLVEPLQPLQQDLKSVLNLLNESGQQQLRPCQPSRMKPVAIIDQTMPAATDNPVVELGQTISLTSIQSKSHPYVQGELIKSWIVQAPKGSNIISQPVMSENFDVHPDSVGLYQVLLLVQDRMGSCHVTAKNYVITDNEPLKEHALGQQESVSVADIDLYHIPQTSAAAAWEKSQGEGVLIAIIDSGVNYNHPLLRQNIAVNAGEIPDNGIDDDNNGYVDDYIGYDFNNSDAFPFDDAGHGTHVAGLAASPVLGIAPKAKILPIKALSALGGDQASVAGAIYYAVDRGAQVINLSLGGYGEPHPFVMKAIRNAQAKGVTIVAAAGNGHPYTGESIDTDVIPNYPSALPYENIIAVAASSKSKYITSYSNYGKISVDISAPGGGSESPLVSAAMRNPQGILFESMSGTSMAAVVSGAVAIVKSYRPELSPALIRAAIMSSGDPNSELAGMTASGKN
ncbi:MAG: S8 family peptidase [Bdellovibrionales bacterium]